MATKLTDKLVKAIEAPASGNRIVYDGETKGFGLRVTPAGAKAWVLNYRAAGRERRLTIGAFPDWLTGAARERAKELKRQVDIGEDPMGERHRERAAPTVADLADCYIEEHGPRKRARSLAEDKALLRQIVLPRLGKKKVDAVCRADVSAMHREVSATAPVRANRALALVSKMMSLSIEWEIRADNPATRVRKNDEERRERYLSAAELVRLTGALAAHRDQRSANAVRLLLLTGARRGELMAATWAQFDLEAGVWLKPSASTKQKRAHRVPLNGAAVGLLTTMRAKASGSSLFEGLGPDAALFNLKRSWAEIRDAAGLEDFRLHDLRHSFASILASSGLSLPTIGALLGHTQAATTARYAHLVDSMLREATERVGAMVSASVRPAADVVAIRKV